MRFHFMMLLIVIFVSLGMHSMASAATRAAAAPYSPPQNAMGGPLTPVTNLFSRR